MRDKRRAKMDARGAVLLLVAIPGAAVAQTMGPFGGEGLDAAADLSQVQADDVLPAVQEIPAPAIPVAAGVPAAPDDKHGSDACDRPRIVTDASEFSLTPDEFASARHAAPDADSDLGRKLRGIFCSVYAWDPPEDAAAPPHQEIIRHVSWNINDPRSKEAVDRVAAVLSGEGEPAQLKHADMRRDFREISEADVVSLQEIGLPEAIQLASRLRLHLLWGPEFIEIGPKIDKEHRDPLSAEVFTGSAILSRYPNSDPALIRFRNQGNWYRPEKRRTPIPFEVMKRRAFRVLFGLKTPAHETRLPPPYGGRMALGSTAGVPLPRGGSQPFVFMTMHYENKGKPELRRAENKELHPFILRAGRSGMPVSFPGDLNTNGQDGRNLFPLVFLAMQMNTPGKAVTKTVMTIGFVGVVPHLGLANLAIGFSGWLWAKEHPDSRANADHLLFADDYRVLGIRPSNERDLLGYKHTASAPRPLQIAGGTVDIFRFRDETHTYHVSRKRTYEKLVTRGHKRHQERVSDHFPIMIEIPLRPQAPLPAGHNTKKHKKPVQV